MTKLWLNTHTHTHTQNKHSWDSRSWTQLQNKHSRQSCSLIKTQRTWTVQWKPISIFHSATAASGPGPPHYRCFTITLRHTTLGRTPLGMRSARRRDVSISIHSTHKRQTSMPPAGFEPATPASELPRIHALDRAAAGIGSENRLHPNNFRNEKCALKRSWNPITNKSWLQQTRFVTYMS
jgi:hypothetical protein